MKQQKLTGVYQLPSGQKVRVGTSVDLAGRDWNAVYVNGAGMLTLSRAFIEKWCEPV